MLQSWEISVLVYHYLQKCGYSNTRTSLNKECPSLQIPEPPPKIFTCVAEKILSCGDLEFRLKGFDELHVKRGTQLKKIEVLEKEVNDIRKKLKKRKIRHISSENRAKQPKLSKTQEFETSTVESFPYNKSSSINFPSYFSNLDSPIIVPMSTCNERNTSEDMQITPDKILSTSRRKTATPKKLASNMQESFIQTLTDNINAKNEVAALDTLNQVEPWLEQFISSLSEDPATTSDTPVYLDERRNNKEAALSLLALNQPNDEKAPETVQMLLSPELPNSPSFVPPLSVNSISSSVAGSDFHGSTCSPTRNISKPMAIVPVSLSTDKLDNNSTPTVSAQETIHSIKAASSPDISAAKNISIMSQDTVSPSSNAISHLPAPLGSKNSLDSSYIPSLDPILIKNAKTMSIARNDSNMDIIVLPQINSQYQNILPRPDTAPSSYRASINSTAPVYTFVKPSPQQEAQKFFGQMQRPYHQQLSKVEQLYLVNQSVGVKSLGTENRTQVQNDKLEMTPKVKESYNLVLQNEPASDGINVESSSQTFSSWDQKIRQSIVDFKAPCPPNKQKKTRKPKPKIDFVQEKVKEKKLVKDVIDKRSKRKKSKSKHKKNKKKEDKELNKSSLLNKPSKSRKKKQKKERQKDTSKKSHITPEFVNESLSSGTEESFIRSRCFSESDTVMAETLLETLNTLEPDRLKSNPDHCSTPVPAYNPLQPLSLNDTPVSCIQAEDPMKPAFIEENANSSFDINEATRPKPVVMPEGSQKSCSCHSSHYKESFGVKNSGKIFSFKEQDNEHSPKNYNENSSITVATLFPSLSISPTSHSAKITDTQYRSPKLDDDSDNCEAEERNSDEEIRENTSNLPPVSSQNKDLLESSEDEAEKGSNVTLPLLTPNKHLSLNLSESDFDSPVKHPAKVTVQSNSQDTPITARTKDNPTNTDGIIHKDGTSSVDKKLPRSSDSKDCLSKVSAAILESGTILEEKTLAFETEICSEIGPESSGILCIMDVESEFNDSQDLVIDGDESLKNVKTCKTRPTRGSTSQSTLNTPDKASNAETHAVEDSCDTWYQNVPNKMKPKASFSCGICRKTFPSLAVLTVHNESCSKIFLICSNCGKKCSSKSGLTLHKKTCLNPQIFKDKMKEKLKISEKEEVKTKIKIAPTASKSNTYKKSLKKKKAKEMYMNKDIDNLLDNLRYSEDKT